MPDVRLRSGPALPDFHDGAVLERTSRGWALATTSGRVVLEATGAEGRRACLEQAGRLGALRIAVVAPTAR